MAVNQVAEATTGTFDQIKGKVVNAANWLGRQVASLATSIKDLALRVVEWAKPFFNTIAKFFVETFDKTKEYIVANKEIALPAALIGIVGTVIGLACYHGWGSKDGATAT
ncbi:MAG: hypothetical protein K1000chlam2_01767 [Chlamydiae bacterium]|nr:hypothetical protein [Chlamydiota bacterium]